MIYEFEVPGKVVGKARPRLNSYTGTVYTPTKTKDYETLIEQYFLLKYPRFKAVEGRAKVSIVAYFSIPKTNFSFAFAVTSFTVLIAFIWA